MSDAALIEAPAKARTPWGAAGRRLLRAPAGWASFAALLVLVLLAAFGPLAVQGEDARVFDGLRETLLAGASAGIVALVFGLAWGVLAASSPAGGAMMWIARVLTPMPLILFVVALTSVMTRAPDARFIQTTLAIGATLWMPVAAAVGGKLAELWRVAFVEAARAGGMHALGIFVRHIAPNLSGVLAIAAIEMFSRAVLTESLLSFLDLGLDRSLGALLGVSARAPETILLFWAPLALLFVTLLALTLASRSLRDALEGSPP